MTIVGNQPVDLRPLLAARAAMSPYLEEGDDNAQQSLPPLGSLYVTQSTTSSIFEGADYEWVVEDSRDGSWADFPEFTDSAVESLRAAFWAELMSGKLEHSAEVLATGDPESGDMDVLALPLPEAAGEQRDLALCHFAGEPWTVTATVRTNASSPAQLREIALQLLKLSFAGELLEGEVAE
jgi:hypothetical protein